MFVETRRLFIKLVLILGASLPMAALNMAHASPSSEGAPQMLPVYQQIFSDAQRMAKSNAITHSVNSVGIIPPPSESLLQDKGGIRPWLAEHNMGFQFLDITGDTFPIGHQEYQVPASFKGQRNNWSTNYQFLFYWAHNPGTVKGGRFVLDIGGIHRSNPNLGGSGPLGIIRAYWENEFALGDGRLGYSLGIQAFGNAFINVYIGGSLASGTQGVNAIIPFEVGFSVTPAGAPGATIWYKYHNWYNKFGVERSKSPDGVDGYKKWNAFHFSRPHTGALYVDEFGYKQKADPEHKFSWFRVGFIYNTSQYQRFDPSPTPGLYKAKRSSDNYAKYLLFDYQAIKFNRPIPADGLYFGASYYKAPSDRNLFDMSLGLRAYIKGPFASRPFDQLSFIYSYSKYSAVAKPAFGSLGMPIYDHGEGYTVSYAYRLIHGAYLNGAVSYNSHPAFNIAPGTQSGVTANLTLAIFL